MKFCKYGGYKKKKYNPIADLAKFTSNKKILSGVVTFVYKTTIKFFAKFRLEFNYVGSKKFRVVTNYCLMIKKIINF